MRCRRKNLSKQWYKMQKIMFTFVWLPAVRNYSRGGGHLDLSLMSRVSLNGMILLAPLCDSLMPLLYTFNAGQRWGDRSQWYEHTQVHASRTGGRQGACNRSCLCMFFLKMVRWMVRCMYTPYYQVNPAPLSLRSSLISPHCTVTAVMYWWRMGCHTHTHTH